MLRSRSILLFFWMMFVGIACHNLAQESTPLPPPGGAILNPTVIPAQTETLSETPIPTIALETTQSAEIPTSTLPQPANRPPQSIGAPFMQNINPLTGLPWTNPAAMNHRPIVVKISNSPAIVRPQAGIGLADHVYEHYTEVGITRFSAVFHSETPNRVGSIRSARLIDYEIVPMYEGVLAFAGSSIGVDKRLYGSETMYDVLCGKRDDYNQCLAEADVIAPQNYVPPSEFASRLYRGVWYGRPYYFRDEAVTVPNNLFVDLGALRSLAEADGHAQQVNLEGMLFNPDTPPAATGSGIYLETRYRTTFVQWHYDEATGQYYRTTDNQRHFDELTQRQISADNVVVVYAGHYLTDIVESGRGENVHYSAHIAVWGEGEGIVFRDGLRYEGRWYRPLRSDMLMFFTSEGEHLYFKPGQTWFQVVPLPEQMDAENEWVRFD
ncbi:MAG: DUF3048 domain-containing protein [Aggregatilineales bacterium]